MNDVSLFHLDSVWVPSLLDCFFFFFFLFIKENSVDSRLNSFESQMSVWWKLKVNRQMEFVRSTNHCQNRRWCPGQGRHGGSMAPVMAPDGGEGQRVALSTIL